MRKLCLLVAFVCPWASAQVLQVESHSLMRLPNTTSSLTLERLDVAQSVSKPLLAASTLVFFPTQPRSDISCSDSV